ncbi:MAG: hypothetical protein HQK53_01295 [Oligoflexia bacterium]|nr:hypothetical protein [Oligoflexia bacterium]
MKKIFIDPGDFYFKVLVLDGDIGQNDKYGTIYGRTFFPSMICEIPQSSEQLYPTQIHYQEEDNDEEKFYQIGQDSSEGHNQRIYPDEKLPFLTKITHHSGKLFFHKILFDFSDHNEEIEVFFVIDALSKLNLFQKIIREIGEISCHFPYQVKAMRRFDQRIIRKDINLKVNFLWGSEGIAALVQEKIGEFRHALVVDIGHNTSKVYAIDFQEGVRYFQVLDIGMFYYYQKLLKMLLEAGINEINYLWAIKQIELGCEAVEIEIAKHRNGQKEEQLQKNIQSRTNSKGKIHGKNRIDGQGEKNDFDISTLIDNVRWDLNKDFNKEITNIISAYFVNLILPVDALLIMGGGAVFSGEILRTALIQNGYNPRQIYVDHAPLYNLLLGIQLKEQKDSEIVKESVSSY